MATNTTANNKDIDFDQLSQKMRQYISKTGDKAFDAILFLKKYFIVVIILIIGGVAYGIYSQKQMERYKHEIIVIPNFGSIDYLYSKVENLGKKTGSPEFARTSGSADPENYLNFEVEPVVDLFNVINNPLGDEHDNDRSYQVFKILSENGDMDKILEEGPIARNYQYYKIIIATKKPGTKQQITDPILNHLNSNAYFGQIKEDYKHNLEMKIAANDSILHQIDEVFDDVATLSSKPALMYYDESELYDVLRLKKRLINEQGLNRIMLKNYDKIIKERSVMLNKFDTGIIARSLKFVYPILFILVFAGIMNFISFYKRQSAKRRLTETPA